MSCESKGHILNADGFCRLCGVWLVDINGPLSPFPHEDESPQDIGPQSAGE